jgi:competence/damage-inducible protein CinA-like protein
MKATIIAVGSEMLTPFRVDTNSLAITGRLNAIGYDVGLKAVVGDAQDDLVRVFRTNAGTVDLIVCTGGLGPTEDDVTRDALARLLDVPLDVDQATLEGIRVRFAARGLEMPAINRRQAMVPRGATVVPNSHGTAPGLLADWGGTRFVLLPGPPREMMPMIERLIETRAIVSGHGGLFRRVLKVTGRTESDVDATAQPVYSRWTTEPVPITTTILAVQGEIELHLTATAGTREEADAALGQAATALKDALGPSVYSTHGERIEAVVGDLLREAGWSVAVAESCTGGLLASRLTDVPGSSQYFDRGVVCYSNQAKTDLAGVPPALIEMHGAVSEPVAVAMAEGIRGRAGSTVGIGITGIAGPTGGTDAKPVGTVSVAVLAAVHRKVRTFRFIGGRELVKFQSAQAALNMLRLLLLERAV